MSHDKMIRDYYENVNKQRMPYNFWSKDSLKTVLRHLIYDVHKFDKDEIYKNIDAKFFKQNKIGLEIFPTIFEAMDYSFKELNLIPWKFKGVAKGFWNSIENRTSAVKWLIEELLINKTIDNVNDLPSKLRQKHFKDYGLSGLSNYMVDNKENVYDLLNVMYPNKWDLKDFIYLKKGYKAMTDDESKYFIRDLFINKLNYKTREDFMSITQKTFKEQNLDAFLRKKYNASPSECIMDCFPEYEFSEWEFSKVKFGYWQDKNNRIAALKNLIENKLKLKTEEIPSVISYKFLENYFYKFRVVLDKYYKSNIFSWINEVYPDVFKESNFYEKICIDGTKVTSKEELLIHNFFVENLNNEIKYIGNNRNFLFENKKCNENYIPDWIFDKSVIVEYFGLYRIGHNHELIKLYTEKTNRKVEYFSNYCKENPEYKFIPIFPDDLKSSFKGLKEKLASIS